MIDVARRVDGRGEREEIDELVFAARHLRRPVVGFIFAMRLLWSNTTRERVKRTDERRSEKETNTRPGQVKFR